MASQSPGSALSNATTPHLYVKGFVLWQFLTWKESILIEVYYIQ
jgi:hypothetical protein